MFVLDQILRENIRKIKPYSSARDEYSGTEGVFLDANENPIGTVGGGHYHRYPDPMQSGVKELLAQLKRVEMQNIFLGNGSDEAIDLLFRMVCEPGKDNVLIFPPTYGMYQVSADINNVEARQSILTESFQINLDDAFSKIDERTKIVFVCSPNNPTGNNIDPRSIYKLLDNFNGIVVVDEAYIDFSYGMTFVRELSNYPNLLILQTFSKAWGMAGLRLGMAFGSKELITIMNRVKPPYNVNQLTQKYAVKALQNILHKEQMVQEILFEREKLIERFNEFDKVQRIYHSEANFILIKVQGARNIYNKLIEKLVIVRDRSSVVLCEDCLRISVGTKEENEVLLKAFAEVI